MQSKKCIECDEVFFKNPKVSQDYWETKSKYCSLGCSKKNTLLQKGNTKGVRFGRDKDSSGANNCKWKGDKVGYDALHDWCKRHFVKSECCERCGITEKQHIAKTKVPFDLSNNGVYDREKENWEWLCRRCHRIKDVCKRIQEGKMQSNNKSGVVGVCWDKKRQRWIATIGVNRKSIKLGRFLNKEEAIAARKIAEKKYFKQVEKD